MYISLFIVNFFLGETKFLLIFRRLYRSRYLIDQTIFLVTTIVQISLLLYEISLYSKQYFGIISRVLISQRNRPLNYIRYSLRYEKICYINIEIAESSLLTRVYTLRVVRKRNQLILIIRSQQNIEYIVGIVALY